MKKVICALALVLSVLSASAKRIDRDSYYYRSGYTFEIGTDQFMGFRSSLMPCGSVGIGYREGNGFDSSIIVGCDCGAEIGCLVSNYYQLRYHIFNSKFSPFVSAGIGVNWWYLTTCFAPAARVAAGCSCGRFSLYYSYERTWLMAFVSSSKIDIARVGISFAF